MGTPGDYILEFVKSLLIECGGQDDGCTPVIDDLLSDRITAYAEFYVHHQLKYNAELSRRLECR